MTRSSNGNSNDNQTEMKMTESLPHDPLASQKKDVVVSSSPDGVSTITQQCHLEEPLDESRNPMHQQVLEDSSRQGNGGFHSPQDSTSLQSKSRFRLIWTLLRTLVVDLPLAVWFLLFVVAYVASQIHNVYFVPFFEAAYVSDERLKNEHTYYERWCTPVDITTRNVTDLVVADNSSPEHVVDTIMVHGGAVIPKILQPSTIQKLREFIVQRHTEIDERGEAYPVSQGDQRASFGIDAAEDPIVAVALREVASNPLVSQSIQQLVGPDPAVAEISEITSWYGAEEQAWHSDVKIDGNAVKFARTFTHSYSLFLPLQDVTETMGATEICPGTHYCANEDLIDLCDEYGMQMHEASEDQTWHAGDGALLSQQVWHRGHAHTDPNALERIVFIVTFISRPQVGLDHRQLSRGTYFHLKWNMWGHTLSDLLDAGNNMKWPYSTLRCLGLWKRKGANWGFDLFTSSVMRIANLQGGFEPEDLPIFVENVVENLLHIPEWLQAEVKHDDRAWQLYIQETLDKCYEFMSRTNAILLGVYLLLVLLVQLSFKRNEKRFLARTLFRTVVIHGILFLLGYLLLQHVAHSGWGIRIQKGLALFPPFASEVKNPPTWTGKTTLPERQDVLVGSRFDGQHLHAFNRWLDYHPGNVVFRRKVSDTANLYKMHQANPLVREYLLDSIISNTAGNVRFLQQAHDSGNWIVMTNAEAKEFCSRALIAQNNPLLAAVDERLRFLLAEKRFGIDRGTRLAQESESLLLDLRNQLYSVEQAPDRKVHMLDKPSVPKSPSLWKVTPVVAGVEHSNRNNLTAPTVFQRMTYVKEFNKDDFNLGDIVWGLWDGEWFKGVISFVHDDDSYDVAYEDGEAQRGKPKNQIVKHLPLQEGDRVKVDYRGEGMWYYATVNRVMPGGDINVVYDDGQVENGVEQYNYREGPEMFLLE